MMMRELAYANLSEIEAGKIAQSKSQNEEVKSFAQKMIDDHTKAQQDLEQLVQNKSVTLPTEPDRKHQAMLKKLDALSSEEFDRQYAERGGLADHKAAHRLLQRIQSQAKDADFKQLADRLLPTIEQHLKMAQNMQSSTKMSSKKPTTVSGAVGEKGESSRSSATSGASKSEPSSSEEKKESESQGSQGSQGSQNTQNPQRY